MAGFKGQVREPVAGARARRNAANLAASLQFIDPASTIFVDGSGFFQLRLTANGGLENISAALGIKLITDSLLTLSTSGLGVDTDELFRRHQIWG